MHTDACLVVNCGQRQTCYNAWSAWSPTHTVVNCGQRQTCYNIGYQCETHYVVVNCGQRQTCYNLPNAQYMSY